MPCASISPDGLANEMPHWVSKRVIVFAIKGINHLIIKMMVSIPRNYWLDCLSIVKITSFVVNFMIYLCIICLSLSEEGR